MYCTVTWTVANDYQVATLETITENLMYRDLINRVKWTNDVHTAEVFEKVAESGMTRRTRVHAEVSSWKRCAGVSLPPADPTIRAIIEMQRSISFSLVNKLGIYAVSGLNTQKTPLALFDLKIMYSYVIEIADFISYLDLCNWS